MYSLFHHCTCTFKLTWSLFDRLCHAGVSGGGGRQEYFRPSTAADPHFRGQPPLSMESGMLFNVLC